MKDMFGRQLKVGQHALYADEGSDDLPILCLYRIREITLPNVCIAELLNGGTGNWYYLEDTERRCSIIGDANKIYNAAEYYSDSTIN